MAQAYLHRVDVALAEAFAEHLAPIIRTERVGLCLGDAFQLIDLDKVMATFRARNELPHLPDQIDEIAWQRTTKHRWLDLVETKIVRLRQADV